MYNAENWKVWIPAGIGAYFAAGLVYYFCHFVSNSFGAAGVVALVAAFGYFLLFASRANGSAAQVLNPLPMLIEVPPIRVLAEVKDALATRHFGDKKWSLDNMNEQKGAAQFSCRVQKEQDKNNDQKEHIAILTLKSERLSKASTMQLHYEIIGDEMHKHDALKLCKETTEYLERQMQNLITNPKSWV